MQRRSFFTLSALALLASSLPLSAFAIDEAKRSSSAPRLATLPTWVTDAIKPTARSQKATKVKLVEFTDYVTPNIALADGSLDVNCFQHKPIWRASPKTGVSLAPITQVPTGPMGLAPPASWGSEGGERGKHGRHPERSHQPGAGTADVAGSGLAEPQGGSNPLKASEFDVVKNPHNLKLVLLEAAQLAALP